MDETETAEAAPSASTAPPLLLNAIEARIVGSLVEKQATTPDAYPLTLNAVASACNQKTSREPVTDFEIGEVGHALRQLEGKGLVAGSLSARASRYAHRFDESYGVTPRQRALLAVLLLRGAQTINELHVRSERFAEFPDADEVRSVLERLISRSPALVVRIPRQSGQREDRYMHLLCGPVSLADYAQAGAESADSRSSLGERVERLETLVASLQAELAQLRARLGDEQRA